MYYYLYYESKSVLTHILRGWLDLVFSPGNIPDFPEVLSRITEFPKVPGKHWGYMPQVL